MHEAADGWDAAARLGRRIVELHTVPVGDIEARRQAVEACLKQQAGALAAVICEGQTAFANRVIERLGKDAVPEAQLNGSCRARTESPCGWEWRTRHCWLLRR